MIAVTDLFEAMTERFLLEAGLAQGMRVLDVGCGRGDVSFVASRLVGAEGRVVGIDRDHAAVAEARARAEERGPSAIAFEVMDLGSLGPRSDPFDAVVGRRVLMYQQDAVDVVRRVASVVRPDGLVFFQEVDATMTPASVAPLALRARVHEWIWRTVEREGADVHMGFHLASTLAAAGLLDVQVRAEAVVETQFAPRPLGPLLRVMLPRIERQKVATAEEIDVDSIDERLREELQRANATYVGDMHFAAWARTSM